MSMRRSSDRGFTLIELLTVIAIIGILASLTAVVLPRALERAKIARLVANMKQIQTALVNYYADHGSYPPRYGYLNDSAVGVAVANINASHYVYSPYLVALEQFQTKDLYDGFADSGDTNRNGSIDLLEYSPQGRKTGPNSWRFNEPNGDVFIYDGSNQLAEVNRQLRDEPPIGYFPVNKTQMRLMGNFWFSIDSENPRPRASDGFPGPLTTMTFPPVTYDAAVLISAGPEGNVRGLVPTNVAFSIPFPYAYHVLSMMAYFLASRDANDNGDLDFDFRTRSRDSEGLAVGGSGQFINELPDVLQADGVDAVARNAGGPIILVIK